MNSRISTEQLDFHISYKCNQKCVFCSEAQRLDECEIDFVPAELVLARLQSYWKQGLRFVLFTGGEPFLHPELEKIITESKNMGYYVSVSTNGTQVDTDLFDAVAPSLDRMCVSFHAHKKALFKKISNNTDGYEEHEKFLNHACKHTESIYFMTNVVLQQLNTGHIVDIMEKICSYNMFKMIFLSNIAPEGRGADKYKDKTLRLSEVAQKVNDVKYFLHGGNVEFRVFGVPFCILGPHGANSNDIYWSTRMTVEADENACGPKNLELKETISEFPVRERVKPEKCKNCSCNSDAFCGGVFTKYFELYGDEELMPIQSGMMQPGSETKKSAATGS